MSKKRNKFIVLEGIDGSGKTSIAKALAQKLHAYYYYSPPEVLRPFRKIADAAPYILRYYYYCLGNYLASREIKRILETSAVVADWYIYSTAAYHSALLGRKVPVPNVSCLPDIIVHAGASMDIVNERLNTRPHRHKFESEELLREVAMNYAKLFEGQKNVITLDSSGSVDESLDILEERLKSILSA